MEKDDDIYGVMLRLVDSYEVDLWYWSAFMRRVMLMNAIFTFFAGFSVFSFSFHVAVPFGEMYPFEVFIVFHRVVRTFAKFNGLFVN